MAEVVRKEQCPKCESEGRDNSMNNLAVYSDGGKFCFARHGIIVRGSESTNYVEEKEYELVGAEFNEEIHNELKGITSVDPRGFRGLTKSTCQAFGVRHEFDGEGNVSKQYYPTTTDFELTGYKWRGVPKSFGAIGDTGKLCDLFMQFKFKTASGKYCVITSGELDSLSAFQMLRDYQVSKGNGDYEAIPVVSSTIGESGSHKQIQAQYEWFDRFERLIIAYDSDEVGKASAEKVRKVLPRGKVFLMDMALKDCNKYLEEGKQKEWINLFFKARQFVPEGVTSSLDLEAKMLEYVSTPRLSLPPFMHKLERMLCGGIPQDCIVNILSASGTGKSTFADAMILHWIMTSGLRVGIVSLEVGEGEYGVNLSSSYCQFKLNLLESTEERVAYLKDPVNIEKRKQLWQDENGDPRFYLVDSDVDSLKARVEYLIVGLSCKVIILDPLQDVFDALGDDEQAKFMKWQKDVRKREGVIFININHSRKSGQGSKANSRGAELSEEDMHGHSSIFKSGGINIILMRDKEAEDPDERNTTRAKLTKARGVGNTGNAGEYYYDNRTHQLWDKDDWMAANGNGPIMDYDYQDNYATVGSPVVTGDDQPY